MDSGAAISNAQSFFAEGRTREALNSLKTRLVAHPEELDVRRELAEMYRTLGHADQAGRWGMVLPGWTSKREVAAFGRAYGIPGVSRERVRELLALPPEVDLPDDVERLYHARTFTQPEVGTLPHQLESAAGILAGGAIIGVIVTMIVTTVISFLGIPDTRVVTRVCLIVTAVPVAGSGIAIVCSAVLQRRWLTGVLALVVVVPAALMFYWLAPSPGAYFPWEITK